MRTLIFVLSGLAVLALILLLVPAGWRGRLALGFIPAWLVVSGVNLAIGLSRGYSLREELAVHAVLFGVPAAAAIGAWLRYKGTWDQ